MDPLKADMRTLHPETDPRRLRQSRMLMQLMTLLAAKVIKRLIGESKVYGSDSKYFPAS